MTTAGVSKYTFILALLLLFTIELLWALQNDIILTKINKDMHCKAKKRLKRLGIGAPPLPYSHVFAWPWVRWPPLNFVLTMDIHG